MNPRERETTDEENPTSPLPAPTAPSAYQPPSETSPTDGAGPSNMAARDSEPAGDSKEPLSTTTTTNSPHRLISESPPPEGHRSGSSPSDRRLVSSPPRSRRSPEFRRRGSSSPRELGRRRSRSPLLTEFNRRRNRSPPLMEFGRKGRGSPRPLTEATWHGTHAFRELRRTPPHRGSPPLERFRSRVSPLRMTEFRQYGSPPLTEMRRRGSPPLARHRSPPMADARPYGRINGNQGYPIHAGPISPPHRHRSDEALFDMELDRPTGPSRRVHGFRGGREDGRLRDRDSLLPNGREKAVGCRAQGQSARGPAPHYELRNDPNLSPREGDWICQNPSCGNLNFARRTHCNICNEHRHSAQLKNRSLSPRQGYFPSPPPHHRSPPVRVLVPPPERVLHIEPVRYHRSPPHDWALDAGTFNPRGERLVRADLLECRERGGQFGWNENEEFPRRERGVRDGFLLERRRGRRSVSPLHGRFPRDLREKNRSPNGDRKFKFVRGGGRGNRDFGGYKRSRGNSFNGRSRGGDRVVSRDRSGNAY